MKNYNHNDRAGCVQVRTARITATPVGVYHAAQAGMEDDPESPWATVCEPHGIVITHGTLAVAKSWASHPEEWCEFCLAKFTEPRKGPEDPDEVSVEDDPIEDVS
jgi:hypothetical protein